MPLVVPDDVPDDVPLVAPDDTPLGDGVALLLECENMWRGKSPDENGPAAEYPTRRARPGGGKILKE